MKATKDNIIYAYKTIGKFLNTPDEVLIDAELSMSLNELEEKLRPTVVAYEKTKLQLLKGGFGTTVDKNKQVWNVKQDKIEQFRKELQKILSVETNISFEPISSKLFNGLKVPKNFFAMMGKFVKK